MTHTIFNSIAVVLLIAGVAAVAVIVASLIALVRKRDLARRRTHLTRLLVALASIPCLIGIHQSLFWFVLLPSLARELEAAAGAPAELAIDDSSLVAVGDAVPHFSLTTVDGSEFSCPAGDTVTIINFFATWCGPCRAELPHLQHLWDANKGNESFRMLVIGREETVESVKEFRAKHGFSFPMAADTDRAVFSLFAKESIPRTVVVSPEGQIVYATVGFQESDLVELTAVLEAQLAGVEERR